MAFRKHNSLEVAEKILDILMKDSQVLDMSGIVRVFDGDNEQGYKIVMRGLHHYFYIAFSEANFGNEIIVYEGMSTDNDQSSWDNVHYITFEDDDSHYDKAAVYIFKRINEFLEQDQYTPEVE